MKLSEALRKGSVGRKQITQKWFDFSDEGIVGCCAQGAAMIALFGEAHIMTRYPTGEFLSHVTFTFQDDIFEGDWSPSWRDLVALNDRMRLSFEQIAERLEEGGL